jgi:Uma2 family endonuclease
MTSAHASGESSVLDGLSVNLQSIHLTDEQFYRLCEDNPELRLELTAEGELIVMSPTGSKTGLRNSRLTTQLGEWARKHGNGVAFDSSTGFSLPNGSKRSPDASWLSRERWDALTAEEQEGFAPVCPDFVVELRSPRDSVDALKKKMSEYIDNGASLGWLVDPIEKRVHVFRPGERVQCLESPSRLEGDPILSGFVLDLDDIW